jgi:NDP-sugar pyrophosphorylase family protein
MKAVILAGGRGTRLAPYTTVLPKPLVPIGDMPILEIVIRQLIHFGFQDICLSVGHLAELIQAYLQNNGHKFQGARIDFYRESEPLGTAGALALIPDLAETFLVINGDILTTLNFNNLWEYHKAHHALLTVAMRTKEVKVDLGVIEAREDEIQNYIEKPTLSYLVSMGVYVYEPAVLKFIRPERYLDFPDLVKMLLAERQPVMGYPAADYWLDIGRPEDYAQAVSEFEKMKAQLLP